MEPDQLVSYALLALFLLAAGGLLVVYRALRTIDRMRPRFVHPAHPAARTPQVVPPPGFSPGRVPPPPPGDAPTRLDVLREDRRRSFRDAP